MSEPEPSDTSASDNSDEQGPSLRDRSVRDNWWWSGTLWTVVGVAIVYVQWPAVSGQTDALVFNWILAGAGAVVALTGVGELWKDYRRNQHAAEPTADDAESGSAADDAEPPQDDTTN